MELIPIGEINRKEDHAEILIYDQFRDGLKDIENFSHLLIFWWITVNDNEESRKILQSTPPFEKAPRTGVFSSRSPYRPNPIGLTVVKLLHVDYDTGLLKIDHMDAYEGSPIIDIKPYITNSEHIPIEKVKLPLWFSELNVPRNP